MRILFARPQNLCLVVMLAAALCVAVVPARSNTIEIQTEPKTVLPFEAEAKVQAPPPTVTFKAKAPLPDKIGIRIDLPSETPWLSTDFPLVEGRTLFEIETPPGKDGSWSLRPMFPIRGDYTITSELINFAQPTTSDTFKLHVQENPSKYVYFGLLAAFLFLVGLLGGWLIGGKQQMLPGQLAPTRVELLLSGVTLAAIVAMGCLAVSAEMNIHQHCKESAENVVPAPGSLSNALYSLVFTATINPTVGDLATFTAAVCDNTLHRPTRAIPVEVTVTQLEDNFLVLAFAATTDQAGHVSWKECFFDGAPHKVEISAQTKNGALKAQEIVTVEAIHPPLSRRLTTLAYMMMFLLVGLTVSFTAKRKRQASSAPSPKPH